jgi:hypothetical protein
MANYYLHFSVMLEGLNKKEEEWARAELARREESEDDGGGTLHDFESTFESSDTTSDGPSSVWFHDNGESGNVEQIADFVQSFLKKFRPKDCWGMEWSTDCSKPRLDAYGGGAVLVTAKKQVWMNTGTWLAGKGSNFNKRKGKK